MPTNRGRGAWYPSHWALRCQRCYRYVRREGGCTLCDYVPALLPPVATRVTRYCVHCGRSFECYGGSPKMTCSARCNTRRWRAYTKLAASTP